MFAFTANRPIPQGKRHIRVTDLYFDSTSGPSKHEMKMARVWDLPHTLRESVAQKSVACIRQNGISGCVHFAPKDLCMHPFQK